MSHFLVQAALQHDSGLPEDVTVNTWSVRTDVDGNISAVEDFVDELHAFYLWVDEFLSSRLSGTIIYKAYNRADAEPRVPVYTSTRSINVGTTAMPGEVALCGSFQAFPNSGLPQARRRGRVYIGPLSAATLNTSTGRPDSNLINAIATAMDTLATVSAANDDWTWEVWSSVNADGSNVVNGWVDNDWDTQRSRGERATSRTTWAA